MDVRGSLLLLMEKYIPLDDKEWMSEVKNPEA
jgi:hypothetical protein